MIEDRILRRVVAGHGGCWVWTGTRNRGYGHMNLGSGRRGYVHRAMYECRNGPIPEGLFVLHKCDNPPCVNPDHLWLGTAQDNSSDMVAKGRSDAARGEAHYKARLSDKQVQAVLTSTQTHQRLADHYGVARSTISMIKAGRNRKGGQHR